MFEKLSNELRDAREQAQLSLEQLARQMKIDIKFLQKIEQGDLSFLPELYIKAYLRDYAEFVGLDPVVMMKKYQLAKEGRPLEDIKYEEERERERPVVHNVLPPDASSAPTPIPIIKKFISEDFNQEPRNLTKNFIEQLGPHAKIVFLGVGIFLLILIAGYFIFLKKDSPEIVMDQATEQTTQEEKRYEEPVEQAVKTAANDSLRLRVEVFEQCWMQMVIDSTVYTQDTYPAKTTFTKKAANSIKLIVGNSGGINLFLNDQPFEFTRQKGRMAKFVITKEGIKQVNTAS
ncbi:MAG: DUF4115 domain-containing protein [Ignavibacteria bacterium]|nr:DUF4115 domain-containing protein [Ignavibacteria bacterium]